MSTSNHFLENVRRQSLFLIRPVGGNAQRELMASGNGARDHHRQIVQIDLAVDDRSSALSMLSDCGSFAACRFSSATIASFSFSSSIRNFSTGRATRG